MNAGTLDSPVASDVVGQLVRCEARRLEREGIAMFVALHDARPGRGLRVVDDEALADGARLAQLLDHYRDGLAPEQGDRTTEAALIDVLVVLGDQHLHADPVPVPVA